jgi:hypothetical protein
MPSRNLLESPARSKTTWQTTLDGEAPAGQGGMDAKGKG